MAGIGVGAGLAIVIVLGVLLAFCLHRRKVRLLKKEIEARDRMAEMPLNQHYPPGPVELRPASGVIEKPYSQMPPAELSARSIRDVLFELPAVERQGELSSGLS